MPSVVYSLCAVTSLLCAVLLLARYRTRRERLLLWSAISFGILALNNLLLFADYIVVPQVDLSPYRSASAAIAMAVLLAGLIWES